ncbi:uncharacterized protein LOC9661516 isoform X2 [Selaginella moellendorffii]|uniref:uncharacterized protein LOC9661516 isoform X2 n=1 Tax=Selaginella moellendorffii TaxID=88036 RepID=UPI000D1D0A97|nr:uncharacterized protein LOC9661516 isoform X2 [Selaginella moellendorffii]|eukprot:XP_024521799.1 uncharacterized protein LOC9661516 isoform X2 [Selaginella moellendorffii]
MRCFGCDPDGAPRGEVAVRRFWESIPSATTAPCVCIVPRKAVTPAVIVSRVPGPQTYKRRVQIELDTVTLQRGTAFLHSKKNKLIVRRVYLDFASLAINILLGKVKGRRGNVDNFIVAGTPGTGKTYFGYYLLMQLRNHPAFVNRELIWEESTIDGPGLSFFFRGNEVVEGVVGAFDSRRTEDTVFLCNGPLLRPQHTLSQVVMFSSNKDEAKFTRQFIKDTVCAVVYMPLWDLGELALLYASAGLMNNPGDFTSLKGLFDFWGGSARAVFDTFDDPDYVSRFETALRNARNHKDLDIVMALRQDRDNSSYIFHLRPLDPAYRTAAVVYASSHVKKTLEAARKMESFRQLMDYIKDNKFIMDNAVLVGRKFEYLVHCLLASTGVKKLEFRSRRLVHTQDTCSGGSNLKFDFNGNVTLFRKLRDISGNLGYYVPDYPSYPCYDAVGILRDGSALLLQITRNVRHDALMQYVEDAMEKFNGKVQFLYLVPDEMFDTYPPQRLMWGQTQMTWPCEVSVVGIPADFPVNIMHQIPLFGDEETRDSSDGSKRPIGADATDHGGAAKRPATDGTKRLADDAGPSEIST